MQKTFNRQKLFRVIFLSFSVSAFVFVSNSCSTDFELNAPAKNIWVVYGILNHDAATQDLRIMRAFLPTEDATQFARNNDMSVKGLQVTLTGGGKTYLATQIDSVPTEPSNGAFYPYTTLYRFQTTGGDTLKPGFRYDLEIKLPDSPNFVLRSYTYLPQEIRFLTPRIIPGAGQEYCLLQATLDKEYKIEFQKKTTTSNLGVGVGFEIKAYLDYTELGIEKTVAFGPTPVFITGQRCTTGSGFLCYQFQEKELISDFLTKMKPSALSNYTYAVNSNSECLSDFTALPKAFRFEVTALDTFLTNYLTVNNPKYQDFNTVRPEYTNITGSTEAYGIFGSINLLSVPAKLSPCTEYLLYLNGTPKPVSGCER